MVGIYHIVHMGHIDFKIRGLRNNVNYVVNQNYVRLARKNEVTKAPHSASIMPISNLVLG
jgi:glycerol-3-phosphate cytidylyltransferase-like family protein